MKEILSAWVFLLAAWLSVAPARADEVVVVVNQKSSISQLSHREVLDIFMGRNRKLSSGEVAEPIDLSKKSSECEWFYWHLTGKSLGEIRAYWARLVFTGRASPPVEVQNQAEALQKVAENRNALAYINRSMLTPQVKTVYIFASSDEK